MKVAVWEKQDENTSSSKKTAINGSEFKNLTSPQNNLNQTKQSALQAQNELSGTLISQNSRMTKPHNYTIVGKRATRYR
jgi:hypothetical protein